MIVTQERFFCLGGLISILTNGAILQEGEWPYLIEIYIHIWIMLGVASISLGNVLFQLVTFGMLILVVVLIVLFVRSIFKRNRQLDVIEKKLDSLSEENGENKTN